MTAPTARAWWSPHEPTTVATDLALTIAGGVLAAQLLARTASAAASALAAGLAVLAATALAGAVVHGWGPQLGERRRVALWRLTLLLALVANALLLATAVLAAAPPRWHGWLMAAVAAKLLAVALPLRRDPRFLWVVVDSLVSLVGVAVAMGAAWAIHGAPAAPWMLAGVATSVVAGLVQRSGLTLHRHFNHNDLYHLVQLAAVWLFYRGGLLLGGA